MQNKLEIDGKTYYVKKPGYKELTEAKMYSAKTFNQARLSGAMLKSQLWEHMRLNGIWTEEKQKELDTLNDLITGTETELDKGKNGKYKNISDARKAAIMMRIARVEKRLLLGEYTKLEVNTIDGLAEQAYFDALVPLCILNDEGNKIFASIDEYFEQAGEGWVRKCAEELSYFLYPEIDRNWEQNLPENKFLIKYGFMNNDLSLVNKDGQLVDLDYKVFEDKKVEEFSEFDNDMG